DSTNITNHLFNGYLNFDNKHFNLSFLFSRIPGTPRSTLFPYTTLFRSAGLREAYWRQWEGHYIPEFRVTIREMKEKPHPPPAKRSEEHTSELQSPCNLVCRLLLEKKKRYMDA